MIGNLSSGLLVTVIFSLKSETKKDLLIMLLQSVKAELKVIMPFLFSLFELSVIRSELHLSTEPSK